MSDRKGNLAKNTACPQLGAWQLPKSKSTTRGKAICPNVPPLEWQEPGYTPAGLRLCKAPLLLSKVGKDEDNFTKIQLNMGNHRYTLIMISKVSGKPMD